MNKSNNFWRIECDKCGKAKNIKIKCLTKETKFYVRYPEFEEVYSYICKFCLKKKWLIYNNVDITLRDGYSNQLYKIIHFKDIFALYIQKLKEFFNKHFISN